MRPERSSTQAALLAAVHRRPGLTRAEAAAELGIPSGFAAETVARLVAAGLLVERPAPATGRPGRPTTVLEPHPEGPLVAAVSIGPETWQVAAVGLGGVVVDDTLRRHDARDADVLPAVRGRLARLQRRFGSRLRAVSVAVPGTVSGHVLLLASGLGWHDVDLSVLRPAGPAGELLVGNDATLAGVAEARRAPPGTLLYLHLAEGVGGAVVEGGRAVRGATGAAGEFGHMPFGDPDRRCPCGAAGCWNTSFDAEALRGFLPGRRPVAEARLGHLLAAVAASPARTGVRAAVDAAATAIGRGIAGLVNGLDPHVVVLGGHGPDLLQQAGGGTTAAYHAGLMAFRLQPPPALVAARLGDRGPLLGAAEEAFDRVLTVEGLQAWAARTPSRG